MNKKVIIVTGANGGIGQEILKSLLAANYQVIAVDLFDNKIKDLDVQFIKCDLTDIHDIESAFENVKKNHSSIYAIVNSIGIFKMQSIIEGSIDDFRKIFDINFFAVYMFNKVFFPLLNKGSRIINMSSEVAKFSSQPFEGYYTLSKQILDNYTDVLRREAMYLGIKVIKIQSGNMATPLVKGTNAEFDKMLENSEHFKDQLTKLKYMMDRVIVRSNNPQLIGKKIVKILKKKHPKIRYKIKNSFYLTIVGVLPETWQDKIYAKVIK